MDPVTLTVTLPAALAPLLAVDGRTLALALALLLALALARILYHPSVPRVSLRLTADELATASVLSEARMSGSAPAGHIPCIDPSTGRFLGSEPAASEADVSAQVARARLAQSSWCLSSFSTRRRLLRILARAVLEHTDDICRISSRDSGKTTVDAAFGEVLPIFPIYHTPFSPYFSMSFDVGDPGTRHAREVTLAHF